MHTSGADGEDKDYENNDNDDPYANLLYKAISRDPNRMVALRGDTPYTVPGLQTHDPDPLACDIEGYQYRGKAGTRSSWTAMAPHH